MLLSDFPPMFLRTLAVLFGLVWGSFLNVVIYRVPRRMSVAFPSSHCPLCGKPVMAFDNVPILSFSLLRGRSRCCRQPDYRGDIPWWRLWGRCFHWQFLRPSSSGYLRVRRSTTLQRFTFADFALALALVAGSFIDLEHMYIPDAVTLGGTVLGITTASFREHSLAGSLLGHRPLGFHRVVHHLDAVAHRRGEARRGDGHGLGERREA